MVFRGFFFLCTFFNCFVDLSLLLLFYKFAIIVFSKKKGFYYVTSGKKKISTENLYLSMFCSLCQIFFVLFCFLVQTTKIIRTESHDPTFNSIQIVIHTTQNDWHSCEKSGYGHHPLSWGQTSISRTWVHQWLESDAYQWSDNRQIISGFGCSYR